MKEWWSMVMKIFILTLTLSLLSCGPTSSGSSRTHSSGEKPPDNSKLDGALALAERAKNTKKKISELRTQSELMCRKAQAQRKSCPVAAVALRTAEDSALLECDLAGGAAAAAGLADFELDVSGPAGGKIFLTTRNNTWQSSSVASGSKQKLTWGPRKSNPCATIKLPTRAIEKLKVRSPRVIELPDLFVNFDPDSCDTKKTLSLSDLSKFNLYVGGQLIFELGDLQQSAAGVSIKLRKLLDFALSDQCVAEPNVLDKELQRAIDGLPQEVQLAQGDTPKALEDDFSREVNRHAQLRSQLLGKDNHGCWGFTKLRKLDVRIEGETAGDRDMGLSGAAAQNSGNARAYDFYFGQSMVYSTPDESAFGIFKKAGGFVTSDFSEREIQEVRFIRIVKNGVAYINNMVRKDGFLGIGSWSGFHRYETDLRNLSSIAIYANDQLLFRKKDINFTFQSGSLVWPPNGGVVPIQDSEEFSNLMRRNDCPAEI